MLFFDFNLLFVYCLYLLLPVCNQASCALPAVTHVSERINANPLSVFSYSKGKTLSMYLWIFCLDWLFFFFFSSLCSYLSPIPACLDICFFMYLAFLLIYSCQIHTKHNLFWIFLSIVVVPAFGNLL
jgi:hypothetical protein